MNLFYIAATGISFFMGSLAGVMAIYSRANNPAVAFTTISLITFVIITSVKEV